MTDKEIIDKLAAGWRIVSEDDGFHGCTYTLRMPGIDIPAGTVIRLAEGGWLFRGGLSAEGRNRCAKDSDIAEWKARYCVRLMERGGLSWQAAEDNFNALGDPWGNHATWSLDENPENAADDELLDG